MPITMPKLTPDGYYVAHLVQESPAPTHTINAGKGTVWTLARLKGIAAFLGAVLTYAVTVLPLPGDQNIYTGAGLVLTFISVYTVPNIEATATPKRALLDEAGEPVVSE